MSIIKGKFTSVWNCGSTSITTYAELDDETGSLDVNSVEVDDGLYNFDEEYFEDEEGNRYDVCLDCHEFIMREKCFEGEGNGIDYDGQKICFY